MQNERDREAVRTIYDGTVQRIDEAVGQVVAALQESGELDRTLLIVTSDHGQSLGDHLAPGHMRLLWNSVLDVPLIVRDGRNPQPRRIDTRVSLVDLTPTVLDVLGLPIPEGLHGRSLRAALDGGRLAERPYFAEIQKDKERSEWQDRVAVFEGQFKLIERLGGAQAFDIAADPDELSPLQGDEEAEVRSRLESLAASFQQLPTWGESAENVSPEDLETLRSLGYID